MMRPATPILNLSANLRPSSPPQTPTNASIPPFCPKISPLAGSGHGAAPGGYTPPIPPASLSQPPNAIRSGNGHLSHAHPVGIEQLSPCSSNSSDVDLSESEAENSDSDAEPDSQVPLSAHHVEVDSQFGSRTGVVVQASFIIEELSDFDDEDMEGRDDVVHPFAIEYADSERGARRLAPDDPHMINDLQNLNFRSPDPGRDELSSDDSDLDEDVHQAILERIRAENRRQRMSLSSIGTKRTMSERGSDSDHEDVRPYLGFEEAGSSARRLKRRVAGHRGSLIFQDPPPRIDEVVEPAEELEETETLAKELPFYEYTSMEVDSPRSPYD